MFLQNCSTVQFYSLLKTFPHKRKVIILQVELLNTCCFHSATFQWQRENAMQTNLPYTWISHFHIFTDLGRIYSQTEIFSLRITQSPLHTGQNTAEGRKCHSEWQDPTIMATIMVLWELSWSYPTCGSLDRSICTLELSTTWNWIISQKGRTLFSYFLPLRITAILYVKKKFPIASEKWAYSAFLQNNLVEKFPRQFTLTLPPPANTERSLNQ